MTQKPTVADIRKDIDLGVGSCSIYDECYTDEELQAAIDKLANGSEFAPPIPPGKILREMKRINGVAMDRMAERMGECGW